MADEYIRKQDAIAVAESYQVERTGFHLNDYEYGRNQVADSIASDLEDIELADVAPVVHAHWKDNKNGTVSCSRCSTWFKKEREPYLRFCGYCGAKMDAQGEE